jgi:O-antigen/teichoic acid export membrane protein
MKGRALHAGVWTLVGYGIGQALRLGSNLIMTRLLVPEMFGVMAIANIILYGLALFSDVGLGQSIIQSRRGEEPVFLNTAWVVQIVRGAILCLVALLISLGLYIAHRYHLLPPDSVYAHPSLPPIVLALALSPLISGFESNKLALARRKLELGLVTQIELASQFAALCSMLAWAWVDRSIWALVTGALVSIGVRVLLSHILLSGPKNGIAWDRECFREIIGYGKWIFLSSILGFLLASGDRLMLGGLVDAKILGLYSIAYLMVSSIHQVVGKLVDNISFPLLSEVIRNTPDQARSKYYKLRLPVDIFLLLLTGILFFSGHVIINFLYDGRYAAAGPMLEILSVALFENRFGVTGQFYMAKGVPRVLIPLIGSRILPLYGLLPLAFKYYGFDGALWVIATNAFFSIPVTYYYKKVNGILDVKRELIVLPALVVGGLIGKGITMLVG